MQKNNTVIRKAVASDAGEIHRLTQELEQTSVPVEIFTEVFFTNLGNKSIFYFVSEENGVITGFVSLHIQVLLHHWGRVAEIQELVVHPGFRNRETGKRLLETAVQTARDQHCELIELAANIRREKAHAFYLKNGFFKTHFKFTFALK
ncbi:MAG: GNAT family N-acetyltransferase [Bacteroidota bacterium]|jgi:(aminoalkyl)phosphonate N-acetyltransferase